MCTIGSYTCRCVQVGVIHTYVYKWELYMHMCTSGGYTCICVQVGVINVDVYKWGLYM